MLSLKDTTTRYLMFLCLMLLPWAVVGSLRVLGPVGLKPLEMEIIGYLSAFIAIMFCCYSITFLMVGRTTSVAPCQSDVSHTFLICRRIILLAAVMFPLISGFDFFIVKGASLSEIVALREKEYMSGPRGSLIGALGTLLAAAPPMAFVVYLIYPSSQWFKRLIMWSVIILGFGSLFLSGGRNGFFISVGFIMMFVFIFVTKAELKKLVSPFILRIIYVSAILGFFYSMKIFVDRFAVQDLEPEIMIYFLRTEYGVDVVDLDNASELYLSIYSAWIYLVYYMVHAVTYFEHYLINDVSPQLMGVYNFSIVARLIDVVAGSDLVASGVNSLLVKGVYLTLPGSLFIDFGFMGSLFVAALLGVVYGWLAAQLLNLKFFEKMWLVYLCTIMLFSPFYSVVGIANGFSFLFLLILIVIFSFRLKRRAF